MNTIIRLRCIAAIFTLLVASVNSVAQQPSAETMPASAQTAGPGQKSSASRYDALYRIGPGDVLDVVVAKNDVLSRSAVRVNNEGNIQLPMIEAEISAACRTERELAGEIRTHVLKYMYNPSVYVAIKEYNSQPVAVIGAVLSPGRFLFQRRVRLLELLTFVNGPAAGAGRSVQIIHTASVMRCDEPSPTIGDETEQAFSNYVLEDVLQGLETANPIVQPGDIVRVPEADQVYVIGSVRSAVIIMLRDNITLSQAIARAGGALPDSKIDKVRVTRKLPGSMKNTEIIVDLKAINRLQADDFLLMANDVVEVPGLSGGMKFLKGLLNSVVPAVTRMPISVVP